MDSQSNISEKNIPSFKETIKIDPEFSGAHNNFGNVYTHLGQLDRALERIINWHKAWKKNEDMQLLCFEEIKEYMKDMNK